MVGLVKGSEQTNRRLNRPEGKCKKYSKQVFIACYAQQAKFYLSLYCGLSACDHSPPGVMETE